MPKVSYAPELFEIDDFPHGDTFLPDAIDVIDNLTGNPVDMTTYQAAALRLEEKDGTEVVTLTHLSGITLGNGFIQFSAATTAWPNGCTIYGDLQFITSAGNIETWIKVIVKIKKTITSPV
jgi:hypothetical protein